MGLRGLFNRWRLRTKCSCGNPGDQFDDYYFRCFFCGNTWDGRDEFEQEKVLIKEKNTVIRTL